MVHLISLYRRLYYESHLVHPSASSRPVLLNKSLQAPALVSWEPHPHSPGYREATDTYRHGAQSSDQRPSLAELKALILMAGRGWGAEVGIETVSQAGWVSLKSFLEGWLSQSAGKTAVLQPITHSGKKHRTLTQHRPGVESCSAPCSVCDREPLHKFSGLPFPLWQKWE